MRVVQDLNQDELEELRETYFYQLIDGGDEEVLGNIDSADGIPMSNVMVHYNGVYFVQEDFFCNL